MYQDFNLVMEDGTWKHFEFQSENEGNKGLKRFRTYEAVTSYQNNVEVTTYVLFSGNIKNPMTKLTEGVNTYRVIPIIMKNKNADRIIRNLQKKLKQGKKITKKELTPLMLCPLMGGEMPQKERIRTVFELTRSSTEIGADDIRNMESVLYAMAEKFLEPEELKAIKEVIGITTLSRMFYDDGVREGISQGKEMAQLEDSRKLLKVLNTDKIAEVFEIPLDTVKRLQSTDKL